MIVIVAILNSFLSSVWQPETPGDALLLESEEPALHRSVSSFFPTVTDHHRKPGMQTGWYYSHSIDHLIIFVYYCLLFTFHPMFTKVAI